MFVLAMFYLDREQNVNESCTKNGTNRERGTKREQKVKMPVKCFLWVYFDCRLI